MTDLLYELKVMVIISYKEVNRDNLFCMEYINQDSRNSK
jgi:hypothetical protein